MTIGEEVDAKKQVVGPDRIWGLLSGADTVYVASGRKRLVFKPDGSNREELVNKATGPTGNLRAPTLRIGKNLYIGFNEVMYEDLTG